MPDAAREIENLLYRYAERIDAGDLEGVADLFAHGRVAVTENASPEQIFEGRDRVLSLYRGSARIYDDGSPHTRHVTSNVLIELEEGAASASARSYYTVFQRLDDFPLQPIICGHYHDTFQRLDPIDGSSDGRWWFDTRTMFVDLVGDLSHHLLYQIS